MGKIKFAEKVMVVRQGGARHGGVRSFKYQTLLNLDWIGFLKKKKYITYIVWCYSLPR